MKVLLFTNLYPCQRQPLHGTFVRERTERLAQRMGFDYEVLRPYPRVLGHLGRLLPSSPRREDYQGRVINHVGYPHLPITGWLRQDQRMADGLHRAFGDVLAFFSPDLVDAQYLYPDALAAIQLSRQVGLPCIATARGTDVNVLAMEPRLKERFVSGLQQATAVAAVSPALAGILEREFGLACVHVTPNGVDLDLFAPSTGERPLAQRLISVGRLVPGKAFDLLVEALALESELPPLELIGSGPEKSRLMKLARRRGVQQRLHLRGSLSREELARELSRGGVFAFPSRREGWPNAVLEALACGLPVCASSVGGIPDIVGSCGSLMPLEADALEWARTLRTLCRAYAEEGPKLQNLARHRSEAFSWDQSLGATEAFYEEALR